MENEEIMNTVDAIEPSTATIVPEANENVTETAEIIDNAQENIIPNATNYEVVGYGVNDGTPINLPTYTDVTPAKKSVFKKWWFWLICAGATFTIIVGIIVAVIVGAAVNDSNNDYNDSGYTYVNTYVSMVKNATHSSSGRKYGTAFDNFFSSPNWRHFTSTTGQQVVEFTGDFTYSNAPATARIQFVLDISGGTFEATYLEINDVPQNKLMLSTLIKKVFETY